MESRPSQPPVGRDVLIGRERELDELIAALNDALAGRGRVALISGEAGIGKTRLVQEAAARALAAGSRVWWGRCWEGGGAPPYWPWIQILREALRGGDRAGTAGEVSAAAARIVQALPDLGVEPPCAGRCGQPIPFWLRRRAYRRPTCSMCWTLPMSGSISRVFACSIR